MERRKSILKSVDTLLAVHDEWETDQQAPTVPTEKFENAIETCVGICSGGDVPSDCRVLLTAVAKLGTEWVKYRNGHQTDDFRPRGPFWDAFREVRHARQGITRFAPIQRESVARCRQLGYDDKTIAKIYGEYRPDLDRWTGIFFSDRGTPRTDLIDMEMKEPGSVLTADWVHPDDKKLVESQQEQLETQLENLAAEIENRDTDKASIEEMLREGAFPAQIARAKGVDLSEVHRIANELGIKANEMPNLAALRAPQEPGITREQDAALQSSSQPASEPDDEQLVAQVIEMAERDMTPLQISQELGITPQKVGALKRRAKEAVA